MRIRPTNRSALILFWCSGLAIIAATPRPSMAGEQQAAPASVQLAIVPSVPSNAAPARVEGSPPLTAVPMTGPVLRQPWDVTQQPPAVPVNVVASTGVKRPAAASTPLVDQMLAESGVVRPLQNKLAADEKQMVGGKVGTMEASETNPADVGFISYQPAPPTQPMLTPPPAQPPIQPVGPAPGGPGGVPAGLELPSLTTSFASSSSATNVGASRETIAATQATDLAGAMQQSNSGQTVQTQQRSPVSMDPNIRGFKQGQIYAQASGAYWTPARLDLDTMLSKIDPYSIEEAVVINGPYGVRYGPGFAFIDVLQTPTPRSAAGFTSDFTTLTGVRTNGQQFYFREIAEGADSNYGFRFAYGDRQGSNYRSGDNFMIPSGYHNRDESGDFGFDLTPYRHVEFSFNRLDQTNTDYPGEFFDIRWLGTYGLNVRLTDENPMAPWTKMSVGAWYNRTDFVGDTSHKSDPNFPIIPRVDYALTQELQYQAHLTATSDGNVNSSGTRMAMVFGDADCRHINVGTDFRYLGQRVDEYFWISGGANPISFLTNMPRSWMSDVGTYAEWVEPVWDELTTTIGVRGDVVNTSARAADLRQGSNLTPYAEAGELEQDDFLFSCYMMNRYELNEHWAVTGSVGFAERPPTLTERYADGLFLGVLQSGFTRVIGDPTLEPEKNLQIDLGLKAEYERWRGSIKGFQSWVYDYITYEDHLINPDDPTNPIVPRLLQYRATDLATLTGFEVGNEYDLTQRVTAFMTMGYVDGRDQELDAPLPSIPPLTSTAGLRLHDCNKGSKWGFEVSTRMADAQNRLGNVWSTTGPVQVEERTPGFMIWNLRSYYNYTKNFHLTAGIENVLDRNYLEHLDLRVGGPSAFEISRVYRPGITPYFGLEWKF